jgi:hypothetical protein
LSLNENNVHFLALSEVELAEPYQQLQEVAIKMIKNQLKKLMSEKPTPVKFAADVSLIEKRVIALFPKIT